MACGFKDRRRLATHPQDADSLFLWTVGEEYQHGWVHERCTKSDWGDRWFIGDQRLHSAWCLQWCLSCVWLPP